MMPDSYYANLPGAGREIFDTLTDEDKNYIRENLSDKTHNNWANAEGNMKKVWRYIEMTPSERLKLEAKSGREETLRVKHTALLSLQLVDRFAGLWKNLDPLTDPLSKTSYRKLRSRFAETLYHVRFFHFRPSYEEESLD